MKKFKLQIPADVHCLLQLVCKLGMRPGPMKAASISPTGLVDIWLIPMSNTDAITRVQARLVRGIDVVSEGSPRRVYLDLGIQDRTGVWRQYADSDFVAVGLKPPYEYDGESWIGVDFDIGSGVATWSDMPQGAQEVIPYFRFLDGDRDRAIREAQEIAEELNLGI